MLGAVTEQANSTRRTQVFVLATVVAWAAVVVGSVQLLGVVPGLIASVWGVPIVVIAVAGVVHHRASAAARPAVRDERVQLDLTADQHSLQPVA